MTLDEFAIRSGTDKSSLIHGYCENYQDAIEFYVRKHNVKAMSLLEFGVHRGASLQMWHDYLESLGIEAKLVGVDVRPEAKIIEEKLPGVVVELGSQVDVAFLGGLAARYGDFDIIIDDASHQCKHQIKTFEVMFKHVKPGGIYIVEDVCTSYWERYNNGASMIEYAKALVDDVNFHGIRPEGKNDRNIPRLLDHIKSGDLKMKVDIASMHFFNSTILIYKR